MRTQVGRDHRHDDAEDAHADRMKETSDGA